MIYQNYNKLFSNSKKKNKSCSKLDYFSQVPSTCTLIRFRRKTDLFCSGYGYSAHYNAENDHRKRSHSKTFSRVERLENDFLKTLFSSVDGENDVIWKRWRHQIDTTGRQTTRPLVSKMADRRYHVASNFAPISRADILKCACVEFIWVCALRV